MESLVNQIARDDELFKELLINFYLDASSSEREKMEQRLTATGGEAGQIIVMVLRSIARTRGANRMNDLD